MPTVLLTCAGRRHYLADFFKKTLSISGKVVGADMDLTAPALRACDAVHKLPKVCEEIYLGVLKEVMVKERVDMVFSLNDLEVRLLAENREWLESETGGTVYVPSVDALEVCEDKWRTFQFASEIGIDAPATFLTLEEAREAIEICEVYFPLIVKPRWGSASIGLFVVESMADLPSKVEECKRAVAKSSLVALQAGSPVIIQEVIEGEEYGLDILYDKKESFIGFTAKRKIAMRSGETDKAITVAPAPFEEIVNKISHSLRHRGNLDCDFLERDGKLYLLEFNPRFGGGYPFTHLAGANHVKMLLDDYLGLPLQPYAYQVGRIFAKCDTLVEVPSE